MEQEGEDEAGPTCVLQYIVFPPHTTSNSLETESLSDTEDGEAGSDSVTAPTEADGEVQIITEVWTEPQDGLVTNQGFLRGLPSSEVASRLGKIKHAQPSPDLFIYIYILDFLDLTWTRA